MKIGILGFGNMGAAMGERLKLKYQIFVFDKDVDKTKECAGITVDKSLEELANCANALILAIKPQDFEKSLEEIKKHEQMYLIISIAAGITTSFIEARLGKKAVIRAMPNLPAKVGEGMICITKGKYATDIDLSFVQGLFNRLGKTLIVEERLMDAVTAVSGSGPGFLYELINNIPRAEWDKFIKEEFVPKLSYAGMQVGFTAEQAKLLAETTAQGSMSLLHQSKTSAAILKVRVTSPGGTTEAGLSALKGKVENLELAVRVALKRSEELSRK
ncbi:MAG: pyrroline-5-carboxylate reductase [Candidatus Omnitrophica bacterium]|nr:pyrroline-5-carboxylate reductase [Candidatus Omnitrophota bacterium]